MQILFAQHLGLCFGVRDALALAETLAQRTPTTVLGQLAHNPAIQRRLAVHHVQTIPLEDNDAPTKDVVITAHGAAEAQTRRWRDNGYRVHDATCPLVRKAHQALKALVEQKFFPVVIGQSNHVEVRGLVGDYPQAFVFLEPAELVNLPQAFHYGVVSQTTQPIDRVHYLVGEIRRARPRAEVRFLDTVCQPTKNRQQAVRELAAQVDLVLVVGGKNSNNSRELCQAAEGMGCRARLVEAPKDLQPDWFMGIERLGISAGTSTPQQVITEVAEACREIGSQGLAQPSRSKDS